MITFRETLDAVERLADALKKTSEVESALQRSMTNLSDLRAMLESKRLRQFKGVDEVVDYIQRVAVPQITGIHDSLEVATGSHFSRMRTASEWANRVQLRLQALVDGSVDGYLG